MRKYVLSRGSRSKMADRFLTSFPGRIWGTQRSKLTGFRSLSVPQKGEQRTLEGRQLRVMKLDHLPSKLISVGLYHWASYALFSCSSWLADEILSKCVGEARQEPPKGGGGDRPNKT